MDAKDPLLPRLRGGARCCKCTRRRFWWCRMIFASVVLAVLSTSFVWQVDDENLKSLLDVVETDPKYEHSMHTLLAYAEEQVALHKDEIRVNLAKHGVETIDSIYPGDGYNSVAYGGSYHVLTLLEKEGILKVGNLMGGSGGAASAGLAMSDTSAKKLLKYYMVYSLWLSQTWDMQVLKTTHLWNLIYEHAISDAASWERVRSRLYLVTKCGNVHYLPLGVPTRYNFILHNYTSREQCVESLIASGACSAKAYTVGAGIEVVNDRYGTCSDAAAVTYFPKSSASLLYYGAFYGHVTDCTLDSIDELFRHGVKATIATLRSDKLTGPEEDTIQIVPPGPGGKVNLKQVRMLKEKYPGPLYPYIADDSQFLDLGSL